MEQRHHDANHVLLVISRAYLAAPYSNWERQAAQWASADTRPNFALPVFIEDCEAPTLLAHIKRCDLYGLAENDARTALATYLAPAAMPSSPVAFLVTSAPTLGGTVVQSGSYYAVSNIPIAVPFHFLGREKNVASIAAAMKGTGGRAVITAALHGLRGVGKTTLAAAYADQHRSDYRATWWIRAETQSTMRADLVGLGVRLEWISAEEKEEPALTAVLDKLRDEGDRILLIFDNANSPNEIRKYLPRGGATRIIVTSNAPNWGALAVPVEIEVWPSQIGADFLTARTARRTERDSALALSEALGGLPLAHEQAAAYCDRIGVSLAEYKKRFEETPTVLLDSTSDAVGEYHGGLTVAKTFALAIEEAAKVHPAAKALVTYAALLAPEPIPLYLFSEGGKSFAQPFASFIEGAGLDEAVAALRTFALVDRESVADERVSSITTDCIRLHRLVRDVAAAQETPDAIAEILVQLIRATVVVYPGNVRRNPSTWPRARRLDAMAMALIDIDPPPKGAEIQIANLLGRLQGYRDGALAAYSEAQKLAQRGLAIREKALGPNDPATAISLVSVGYYLRLQGNNNEARPYYERALAIDEEFYGNDHPEVATDLSNLAGLLKDQGDYVGARPLLERALAIDEKFYGPDHREFADDLANFGVFLHEQSDIPGARHHLERALAIRQKVLEPDHPEIASNFSGLGSILEDQGDYAEARSYFERALAIREKVLGMEHPDTANSLNSLGNVLYMQGDLTGARSCYERALEIVEKVFGPDHRKTR